MDLNYYLVILTAVNVMATLVYVFFTYKAVTAMREQTEAIFRPYISISHFLDEDTLVGLQIKNTGRTTAQNLRLTIDKDFYQVGSLKNKELNLRNVYIFNNTIPSVSPNAEYFLALASSIQLQSATEDDPVTPVVFNITATYSFGKKTVTETTTIDLKVYRNVFMPIGSTEKQLSKIDKTLNKLLDYLGKKGDAGSSLR